MNELVMVAKMEAMHGPNSMESLIKTDLHIATVECPTCQQQKVTMASLTAHPHPTMKLLFHSEHRKNVSW